MISIKKRKDPQNDFSCVDISITRGDSAYLSLNLRDKLRHPIELGNQDILHIQVREKPNGGTILFEGTIENDLNDDSLIWHIYPEDTKQAPKNEYFWDAQIELFNGDVFTWIPVSKFILLPEVTEKDKDGG